MLSIKSIRQSFLSLALLAAPAATISAQAVLFPQQEQPGEAAVRSANGEYVLSNNLLSAKFVHADGKLTFGGCEAMNLNPGTELFTIETGTTGKLVKASEMTLQSVTAVDLQGNPEAARGSEKLDGKAIEARFTQDNLEILWRAVLRNGSHYLRTELEITAAKRTKMMAVTPMIYEVANVEGVASPQVVGNTRGAILAGDRIFAGAETPMALNSANGTGATSFDHQAWTPESFNWVPGAETPAGITGMGYDASQIVAAKGNVKFSEAGSTTVTFQYTSGTHRLNIVGVDIVKDGDVVASDYHYGYTGNAKEDNVYTLDVPQAGIYELRFFMETRTETVTSSGSITYSQTVTVAPAEATGVTALVGRWSRNTYLAKDKTWKVSAVVGLIAPGQARRSVLAYSERERAVPWRPFPIYNSWYELNIDRNNDENYTTNFNINQCVEVLDQWKANLYDKYDAHIQSFVWDDGWDVYGTWTFNKNFPNGFKEADDVARAMGSNIGAWLGPVGGYGQSGNYRRNYWSGKGGMQLSNPDYYDVFLTACSNMIKDYQFNFFKFDGISAQFSSVGPDSGTTGEENAEAIIDIESKVRELKPDIFLNTTVGTWASPFWFRYTDAVWRQEGDFGTIGNQGSDREKWITYRDRLVYQNFVQNSPLCPINTLMTHGVILTNYGAVAKDMSYAGILRELRCAFACGSGMVELYCDFERLNSISKGKLWGDIAKCIKWQEENKDVLPDIHWVGGNPWDGTNANVYGWAAWNGEKSTLTLRNPSTSSKTFEFTLREALDIPDYVKGEIVLTAAFDTNQVALPGLDTETPIDIDTPISAKLRGSYVYVFNGIDATKYSGIRDVVVPEAGESEGVKGIYDLQGRKVEKPAQGGIYIIDGRKTLVR